MFSIILVYDILYAFFNWYSFIMQYREGVTMIIHRDSETTNLSGMLVTFFCLTSPLTMLFFFVALKFIIFSLGVRKRDGSEYEPDTLTGIQNSIDRHLKTLKVKYDIKKDETFNHSRRVLEAKRKELKG